MIGLPRIGQADVAPSLGSVSKTALFLSIDVFLNSAPYIIIHGVKIFGSSEAKHLDWFSHSNSPAAIFFTFPRGVAGGRILLPYIWPTIGYPCYPGLNYSDSQLHEGI